MTNRLTEAQMHNIQIIFLSCSNASGRDALPISVVWPLSSFFFSEWHLGIVESYRGFFIVLDHSIHQHSRVENNKFWMVTAR